MKKPTLASCIIGAASFIALLGCTPPSFAARLVDVSVVNRSTGERLTPWRHGGRIYVAGTPGDRYAVELKSNSGERLLTVLSVDGVNAVTGQTAATPQSGYVIEGGGRHAIVGWRKSMDDVAQFVFTALPNSYAALTGRPGNVGVIGVAVYRERPAPAQPIGLAPQSAEPWRGDSNSRAKAEAGRDLADSRVTDEAPAPAAAPAKALGESAKGGRGDAAASGALAERRAEQESKSARLGTGHGQREHSPTRYTEFVRNSDAPDEIVTIYYDSRANLIARGIIPSPRLAEPTPFPGSVGFVPDPRG